MATRPIFNKSDIASSNPAIAGPALAAEYAMQAYPESNGKRWQGFSMRPVAPTNGATAAEAFIDGILGFRFRLAERSTVTLKYSAAYNSSVAGSNTGFDGFLTVTNVGGAITILANSVQNKLPTASTANITFGVDNGTQSLVVTCAGNAGDANGQWRVLFTSVCEITDLG